jgi:hypothetical protein
MMATERVGCHCFSGKPFVSFSSNNARSARSFGLPAARLFRIRSARESTGIVMPSISTSMRFDHASLNSTPSISVITSILRGVTPIWKINPGSARSAADSPTRGAPKLTSAFQARVAFSADDRIQRSMSPVARATPWTASRNSTSWAMKMHNMSRKSGFTDRFPFECPSVQRKLPHHRHALSRRSLVSRTLTISRGWMEGYDLELTRRFFHRAQGRALCGARSALASVYQLGATPASPGSDFKNQTYRYFPS